jgi:excisionase family DNA binding protein
MPEWMKMESIADYCDTSRRNVQNWIYKEGLRHIKVKGTVRIKREWLDQWLEAHEVLKK